MSASLATHSYARLRVGVGQVPRREDLSEWVLSPMGDADEDMVLERLAELSGAVEVWMREGIEEVMNQFNR